MTESTDNKFNNLKEIIRRSSKVIVAFSGGTDSSFLMSVCAEVLGAENVYAVTASSETYTESELACAKVTALESGVRHTVIRTDELDDPVFSSNPKDRCYHCKKHFYSKLAVFSDENGVDVLFDGSNADDVSDYRPGLLAAREFGIVSPLMEAGLTKNEIRSLSKKMNLDTWDKPANPCLASRIPYGETITTDKLESIEKAEKFIKDMGFSTVRVRHHGSMARIEIPSGDLMNFMQDDIRQQVDRHLKELGFLWVTVDIGGYRSGSLNSGIGK